jgi:hypothetical protein
MEVSQGDTSASGQWRGTCLANSTHKGETMIDLDKIKQDNEQRRLLRDGASTPPWNIYKSIWRYEDRTFVAYARGDNAPEVIDELVAEVGLLHAIIEKAEFMRASQQFQEQKGKHARS